MTKDEALALYNSSSDSDKRLYGMIGILVITDSLQRLLHEKSN